MAAPTSAVLHIALVEPEIAPNTGNIARLCAATGARLHLIGRLGFRLDDRALRRAGLDYWQHVDVVRHDHWDAFARTLPDGRFYAVEAGGAQVYTTAAFRAGDCLVFGSESQGLPPGILRAAVQTLTVPMPAGKVRSLNLASTVGIVVYEALRQICGW
jgi:tRNA (cytidine/uridine-2'-O-)-methyltransferase